jgi:hypothetical protein
MSSAMKKQHLSTDTEAKGAEDKMDKRLQDSFPTSDPPSHSPGVIGAPKGSRDKSQPRDKTKARGR